jgi:hypothetical protein
MARRQRSAKRFLLLSTLAVFATVALAQTTNEDAATTATTDAATTAKTTATTGGTTADGTTTTTKATTSTGGTTTSATSTKATTTAGTTTTVPGITSSTSTTSTTGTGTNTAATVPTLSGASTAVTSYPAASVPPTNNAPFMQKSSMPEGTVFIAVGAILGACGAAVLVWRAVVACLLHRSVKRAALAQHMANDKMAVPGAPPPNFYKYTDHESQGSLGAAAGRGVRRTTRGPIPSATPSQTNLFFSPTAGNTGSGAGNRSSTFLPSGFYAAGQGNPQGQGHSHNISMTNLRPDSMATGRPLGHTPPESPGLTPQNGPVRGHPQMSTSTLNLNQASTGRAPSAYLQDLLDEDPSQFPSPAHSQTWAQPHSYNNNNNNNNRI